MIDQKYRPNFDPIGTGLSNGKMPVTIIFVQVEPKASVETVWTLCPSGPKFKLLTNDLSVGLVKASSDQRAGNYFLQSINLAIQKGTVARAHFPKAQLPNIFL